MIYCNTIYIGVNAMLHYDNTDQFIKDYRQYLKDHGISNAHVARKIGISPQQLQNIYKKQELTLSDIIHLCNAIGYNCTINISAPELQPLI